MEIKFLIENQAPDGSGAYPKLGIRSGYIQEAINQVSLVELEVVSDQLLDEQACEDLLDKKTVIALGAVIDSEIVWSRYDGVVFEVEALDANRIEKDLHAYRLVIRPSLWRLNFHTSYRSFPGASRLDAIAKILGSHKLTESVDYKTFFRDDDFPTLPQVVQTDTSDLVFLQQLMGEGGINFHFSAAKDGESPEILRLSNLQTAFSNTWSNEIVWNPGTGQTDPTPRISLLETQLHTTPEAVQARADTGDGRTAAFAAAKKVSDQATGTYVAHTREGQEERVATYTAQRLLDGFVANKVSYQGRSNHLCIRSGEQVTVRGAMNGQTKELLIVSVRHRFSQSATAAMAGATDLAYANTFSAVRHDAPLRPPKLGYNHLYNFISSQRSKSANHLLDLLREQLEKHLGAALPEWLPPLPELPSLNPVQIVMDILETVIRKLATVGMWTAEVIEDAIVTPGGELTCRIANEQFPVDDTGGGGLTALVAQDWLTTAGWLSVLPRKGNFVYFVFTQGEGGDNIPVVIGYRSTADVTTLDPEKTQRTPRLAVGEAPSLGQHAENVVEEDEYEPLNRHRNTLRGENGVSEVAVLDKGDDSVAIQADIGIHMTAREGIHLRTEGNLLEKATAVHQQFESVNRGVAESQREAIGKNHAMTVMGSRDVFVGGDQKIHVAHELFIDNNGEEDITIANGSDNLLNLHKGEALTLKANDDNFLHIDKEGAATLQASGEAVVNGAGNTLVANGDGITLTVGGSTITISKSGDIAIDASNNISITSAAKVEVTGNAVVDIGCGAPTVNINGGTVNIN